MIKPTFLATFLTLTAAQAGAVELQCEFGTGDRTITRHYALSNTKQSAGVTIDNAVYSAVQASDGFQSKISTAISIPSNQRVETMMSRNDTAFLVVTEYTIQEDGTETATSETFEGKCE